MSMNTQGILITIVGGIVALIAAVILVWYSKKTVTNAMSKRHILQMLKMKGMDGRELIAAARKFKSAVVSPKLVPILLVKLEREGLIQRAAANKYALTTKGLEILKNLDSTSKELQKVAKIIHRTSMVSKIIMGETIDRVATFATDSDENQDEEMAIPVYGKN